MELAQKRRDSEWKVLAAIAVALVVTGCAETGGGTAGGASDAAVAISDPVVAFVAESTPGAEGSVVLPSTGQTALVRVVRSYASASGAECREAAVRTAGSTSTRLICRAGTGWREARPLIRDASARP